MAKKKSSGEKPARKDPDNRPMFFGAELIPVCVAFCSTCQERVGEETTDRAKAQAEADAHARAKRGHKVELLCSK